MFFIPAKRALFLYFLCSVIIGIMLFHDLTCFDTCLLDTRCYLNVVKKEDILFFSVEQTYFQIVFVIYEYS